MPAGDTDVREVLVEMYAANGRMNELLMEGIDPRAWRAKPPLPAKGGRTIAMIFAHMHNCRLVWLRESAPHLPCPAALDPARCTLRQTAAAHRKSADGCLRMLQEALSDNPRRRVTKFSRGAWTREWPAGATMFGYMFAHDAHHRGQIIAMAHQLGFRMSTDTANGIWFWDRIWKHLGLKTRPR